MDSNLPDQIIRLARLRFAWPRQQVPLLDIASLDVARGERLFMRGASGSGKSTLLGLIAGVIAPQSGLIEVLGRSLDTISAAARDRFRADHFGIIFQQFNLIPYLSVIENVTLPCQFSETRRRKAISRSGNIDDEALRLLEHLDMAESAVVHKPVTELSVGQQQRVAAARALIGSPEILIADEPTSSMDADRRSAFIELLFRECEEAGSTLLFVSHDQALQEPFDRAIEFERLNREATGGQLNLQAVS
jgi:putative ABC transport system ATP-binding protein